jgi:hypothetical protein
MRLTVISLLVLSLVRVPSAFAAGESATPLGRSVAKAASDAAALSQAEAERQAGNPYVTPALVMIGAGALVAILGSTMPQLRTQTDDYDLCAAANGGPTGPSTRVPACDGYRTANKGMLAVGLASALAGATLLTIGAFKSVTVQVTPGRVVIGKTTRF